MPILSRRPDGFWNLTLAQAMLLLAFALPGWETIVRAEQPDHQQQLEFFENKIRPALVEHCLECHSSETEASGGLLLDSRLGWQRGGDLGAAIIPGDA